MYYKIARTCMESVFGVCHFWMFGLHWAFQVLIFVSWIVLSVSTYFNLLKWFNHFSDIRYECEVDDGWKKILNPEKIVFDDNNRDRKPCCCLKQSCSRSLTVFLSELCVILLIVFGGFWTIHLSQLVMSQVFRREVCVVQQDTFYLH